jgi:hypothetical protein
VEVILAPKEALSKIQHLEIEPLIKLVGEEIKIAKQNVGIKPLIFT